MGRKDTILAVLSFSEEERKKKAWGLEKQVVCFFATGERLLYMQRSRERDSGFRDGWWRGRVQGWRAMG
jgi:hypothetical protein